MTAATSREYRQAFGRYLRCGKPIQLSLKQIRPTPQYVWRTRGDGKVRPAHAANEGRLFSWNDTPETGHPGEGYNCRCEAIPYKPGETEFAYHEIIGELTDAPYRWTSRDFAARLYGGGGTVTLSEIGHLRDIVSHYAYVDGEEGAFRRLSDQIVSAAREQGPGIVRDFFENVYDFTPVSYPHGHSTVFGEFVGRMDDRNGYMEIEGYIDFYFWDIFTDPASLRQYISDSSEPGNLPNGLDRLLDLGGKYYFIRDSWQVRFRAEAFSDESQSRYRIDPGR